MVISRNGVNLILLFVVIGLALMVYLQPGDDAVSDPDVLLDVNDLQTFRLERENGEALTFTRSQGRWQIASDAFQSSTPVWADGFRIDQLLSLFSLSSGTHYDSQGVDLAKYGLQRPRARLIASDKVIDFGVVESLRQRRYLLIGEQIYLISDANSYVLFASWIDFVSPRLLPKGAVVESIDIPGLGHVHRGDNGWVYRGDNAPASSDDMQALVDRWSNVQALEVEHIEGLKGEAMLRLEFGGGDNGISYFVVRNEEIVLFINPTTQIAYQLSKDQAQRLLAWE